MFTLLITVQAKLKKKIKRQDLFVCLLDLFAANFISKVLSPTPQ